MEFISNALDESCKVAKSLFYSYPHLVGSKSGMQDTSKIMRRVIKVEQMVKFLELRGGVYFKCVLIISKLMKLSPNLDYNNLVQFFLFGPKNTYNK
jgi:hypothetical protein